jgi:hypothetical protein
MTSFAHRLAHPSSPSSPRVDTLVGIALGAAPLLPGGPDEAAAILTAASRGTASELLTRIGTRPDGDAARLLATASLLRLTDPTAGLVSVFGMSQRLPAAVTSNLAEFALALPHRPDAALSQLRNGPAELVDALGDDLPESVPDTVALGTVGGLLAAAAGGTLVPWTATLDHPAFPGRSRNWLTRAVAAVRGDDTIGWPSVRRLVPHGRRVEAPALGPVEGIERLSAGNLAALPDALAGGADAVVSLCRVGSDDVPEPTLHAEMWLYDSVASPNANEVIDDAADVIERWLEGGRHVYVHCMGGRSRTAAVVAAVLTRRTGQPFADAVKTLQQTLPEAHGNVFSALRRSR